MLLVGVCGVVDPVEVLFVNFVPAVELLELPKPLEDCVLLVGGAESISGAFPRSKLLALFFFDFLLAFLALGALRFVGRARGITGTLGGMPTTGKSLLVGVEL